MVREYMTIREWLTAYAHIVGKEAIINSRVSVLDTKCSSLSSALNQSFNWGNTPEGHQYWHDLYCRLESTSHLYPPIPKEIEIW